jgi:hypothetical protein
MMAGNMLACALAQFLLSFYTGQMRPTAQWIALDDTGTAEEEQGSNFQQKPQILGRALLCKIYLKLTFMAA